MVHGPKSDARPPHPRSGNGGGNDAHSTTPNIASSRRAFLSANGRVQPPGRTSTQLKDEIDRLSSVVAEIARKRTEHATAAVDEGVSGARRLIRNNPWTSIGVAGALGACLAMITTTRAPEERHVRQLQRAARRAVASVNAGALLTPVENLRGYLPNVTPPTSSLADRIERVGNAISQFDPADAKSPLIEAARRIQDAIARARS